MYDQDLADALRRNAELEQENAALRSMLASWRQVIDVLRARIDRWRKGEGGG